MEDSKIVDLYLARDEAAIDITCEKYGKRLRRLAKTICGDEMMAEECENDTYLGAWNSIPPHEPRSYLYAFLMKIARCLALDRVRGLSREKRSAKFEELSSEIEDCIASLESVEDEIEARELVAAINVSLRSQPAIKKNIFIRRYWFMDSLSTIAKRFDISEGKVKTVLFRLRSDLKNHLKNEGYTI